MEIYQYDKDLIKNSLTIDQVQQFLIELDGEPELGNDIIVSKTICHGGHSHKLDYYDNTKLFRCYTDCGGDAFDIFELVRKVKSRELNDEWELPQAIEYVARYFGFAPSDTNFPDMVAIDDWKVLAELDRIKDIDKTTRKAEIKFYDGSFLKNLPTPVFEPWIKEGITIEAMNNAQLCFNPKTQGIIIPHFDIDGNLIGIRERTTVLDNEIYGKYRPALINKIMYRHPLSFNLYNLNNSKDNIKLLKKVVVFEGEKSPWLYQSYFGLENDISVAVCGSSFSIFQFWLLFNLGVEEIIFAFDKQFQKIGDDEFKKLIKNYENIYDKYGSYVKITYLFDKWNLLDYKSSPIDHGPDVYMELYRKRVSLYEV